MRVAFVTAHPDDAEIAAGGMIAAYRRMGAEVTILCATDGDKGGPGDAAALADRRLQEAREAAGVLAADLVMLGYPDGGLSAAPGYTADLADRIEALCPDIVFAHPAADYHADHRAVAAAAPIAVSFRAPLVWLEPMMGVGAQPTHYIDTTADQDLKERAIRCHASQDPERFVEMARIQGRFRAAQCGHEGFAEAVRHEPVYPFADIRALLPPAPPIRPVRDRRRTAPQASN